MGGGRSRLYLTTASFLYFSTVGLSATPTPHRLAKDKGRLIVRNGVTMSRYFDSGRNNVKRRKEDVMRHLATQAALR